jgi:hypothetical protein
VSLLYPELADSNSTDTNTMGNTIKKNNFLSLLINQLSVLNSDIFKVFMLKKGSLDDHVYLSGERIQKYPGYAVAA